MQVEVYDLEIDEWNEAEAARHQVWPREIRQVLDNEPEFFPNKKGHRAPIVMVGPTFGGRFLTIPLAPTGMPGVWRPATAIPASDAEQAKYRAAHGS